MTYFNIEIQVTEDSVTQAIYDRASKEEAITAYHSSMAAMRSAVDAGTLTECTGMVINSWGGVEVNEHYALPVNE